MLYRILRRMMQVCLNVCKKVEDCRVVRPQVEDPKRSGQGWPTGVAYGREESGLRARRRLAYGRESVAFGQVEKKLERESVLRVEHVICLC